MEVQCGSRGVPAATSANRPYTDRSRHLPIARGFKAFRREKGNWVSASIGEFGGVGSQWRAADLWIDRLAWRPAADPSAKSSATERRSAVRTINAIHLIAAAVPSAEFDWRLFCPPAARAAAGGKFRNWVFPRSPGRQGGRVPDASGVIEPWS